jgi:O-antigen/teichoic acid export membrane protein
MSQFARHSIVRRSILVVAFVILGHALNYVVVVSANRLLGAAGFGRFYTAWALLNVLVAPGTVLTLLVTRFYADAFQSRGASAVFQMVTRGAKVVGPWIVAGVLLTEALFFLGGTRVADSVALLALLPVISATIIAVEALRAAFPAMLRSIWFGVSWVLWCAVQCVLSLIGLALVRSAWAAFAGILAANLLTLAVLAWCLARLCQTRDPRGGSSVALDTISIREAVPFCSAFASFVLLNNADILAAYFLLDGVQLGLYSAAAVLPKAIVTATQPVAQIVLPVIIDAKGRAELTLQTVIKAICVTAAMAITGAGALWAGSGVVCGGQLGIRFCDPRTMLILTIPAICLSVVRVAIAADLGLRRYWIAHIPLIGIVAFILMEAVNRPSPSALATSYSIVSLAVLTAFAVLQYAQRAFFRVRGREA